MPNGRQLNDHGSKIGKTKKRRSYQKQNAFYPFDEERGKGRERISNIEEVMKELSAEDVHVAKAGKGRTPKDDNFKKKERDYETILVGLLDGNASQWAHVIYSTWRQAYVSAASYDCLPQSVRMNLTKKIEDVAGLGVFK